MSDGPRGAGVHGRGGPRGAAAHGRGGPRGAGVHGRGSRGDTRLGTHNHSNLPPTDGLYIEKHKKRPRATQKPLSRTKQAMSSDIQHYNWTSTL